MLFWGFRTLIRLELLVLGPSRVGDFVAGHYSRLMRCIHNDMADRKLRQAIAAMPANSQVEILHGVALQGEETNPWEFRAIRVVRVP